MTAIPQQITKNAKQSNKTEIILGGTVVSARGTANKEAEQLFRIDIQPQKDKYFNKSHN